MNFSLIVCTFMRAESLLALLQSVQEQVLYPDEILIIDASLDGETSAVVKENDFKNVKYFLVSEENRGLTKQRNFGISKVNSDSQIVCFLDDDTVLKPDYFFEVIRTFQTNEEVIGVGGIAINESKWTPQEEGKIYNNKRYYLFEGFFYTEGLRNIIRNYLNLASNLGPGKMPAYSHARTCGFPLTGKNYEVDLLVGMSMSFRRIVLDTIKFSKFFEGYGLYEDADFSLRALKFGKNVINTKVQLYHFHHPSGRPNQYNYGKMVVLNGWYVWRVKNPKPVIKDKIKWHSITLLLIIIRFSNVFAMHKRKEAFTDALGRIVGWFQILIKKNKC